MSEELNQVEGEDLNETCAQVAKMTTIRCLLPIEVAKGWDLDR